MHDIIKNVKQLSQLVKITLMCAVLIGLVAVTIAGAIWVTHTQSAQTANGQRRCDVASYDSYKVVIKDDKARPGHTTAKLCDKLTITNLDDKERNIAFGQHDDHVAYDGIKEKLLRRGQSVSVRLVKPGEYLFHDHFQDEVQGTFSVSQTKQ